jgi:ketosteroid isomerase-like protein
MDINSVRKAVEEGNRRLGSALERKSYGEIAALYTDDAKVLPPDASIVSGKAAIASFWQQAVTELGLLGATLSTLDLEVAGDTAFEVGVAKLKTTQGSLQVKYVVVWRRSEDGLWLLHRDIWNSMPAS